jgi:death-on-curing protein
MSRSVRQLSVEDVEQTAYQMAVELGWREPIPPTKTRYPGKLESALGAPFQTFSGKPIYRGVPAKAAALFYFLVKSHPFQNGNKRIALATLLVYLSRNSYWLKISPNELYDVAVWVAGSPRTAQTEAMDFLRNTIKKYLIKNS